MVSTLAGRRSADTPGKSGARRIASLGQLRSARTRPVPQWASPVRGSQRTDQDARTLDTISHEPQETASHRAIGICYCRHKMMHMHRACDAPMEICMTFNVSAAEMLGRLNAALETTRQVLGQLDLSRLAEMRTVGMLNEERTVGWALLHALEHTALHAGHIQMTRQLWDQRSQA